ncbi:MAG: MGMT family protein [Flavobacteriales bacterium]|nr:MGMT family protein [Flavobacteriales bacterium]
MSEKHKDFFEQVYQVVKLIPSGRVTSYGAIAEYLGAKRGARMVGWAMNASHVQYDVPAHRVVNRNGLLTGKHHFSSPTTMQERLEAEGLTLENDKIIDFDKYFWHPMKELSL